MTIRVLVVDDSAFMRRAMARMLAEDPGLEVVGSASHGREAIDMVHSLAPDVVTLDLEMPGVSGLATLRAIMNDKPTPVVLVSAHAGADAAQTLEALEAGAVDFVNKSSVARMSVHDLQDEVVRKVKAAARSHPKAAPTMRPVDEPGPSEPTAPFTMTALVLGASTGGPPAIQFLLSHLPAHLDVPVLVVQHMPPFFTAAFAQRMGASCALPVREAAHGDRFEGGRVLVAPGGRQVVLEGKAGAARIRLREPEDDHVHAPSLDVAASSAASAFGAGVCLVVLTGMGSDGLAGARAVRAAGGVVVAQDEETSVIYGMPQAVVRGGAASAVAALQAMPAMLERMARGRAR